MRKTTVAPKSPSGISTKLICCITFGSASEKLVLIQIHKNQLLKVCQNMNNNNNNNKEQGRGAT